MAETQESTPAVEAPAVSKATQAAITLLEGAGYRVRKLKTRPSNGPRVPLEKADPATVAAYFEGTGLTRKELAAAAGVSPSVIATVQNVKGDRWSTTTFTAKQAQIAQWSRDHAAEIATRKAADAQALAARQPKPKAAKAATAPTSLAAVRAAKKSTGKRAIKPGRPSPARRAANRKPIVASVAASN